MECAYCGHDIEAEHIRLTIEIVDVWGCRHVETIKKYHIGHRPTIGG